MLALAVKNSVLILFGIGWYFIADYYNSTLMQLGIEAPVLFEYTLTVLPFVIAILVILLCANKYFENKHLDFVIIFTIVFYLVVLLYVHFFYIATIPTRI